MSLHTILQSRLSGIDPAAAAVRATGISLVLTDCDGVLTDATVYCSAEGEALLRFSRRDGMGIERLRERGVATAIVTRELSPIVSKRAEKLGIAVHAGVRDKAVWLETFLAETGREPTELAYMGDDVNDLAMIHAIAPVGLTAAPIDAEPAVMQSVHFVSTRPGGAGAFREFAELLLELREAESLGTDRERSHT